MKFHFDTPFDSIKIFSLICFLLLTIADSCTIIPEGALDYIPSSARIKSFIIEKYDEEASEPSDSYKALVTYQGTFDNPSQIEIVWPAGMQPERIPTFDKTNKITKTIYKLNNWKVTEIANINNQNKTARTETFSYTGEKIKQHIQTNYYNGSVENTYTNDFFYKNESVDSVSQKLCFTNGTCVAGFFVFRLFERNGNNSITINPGNCMVTNGSIGTANCFSIVDYNPQLPYSYYDDVPIRFDNVSQSYYYSNNDYLKTLFIYAVEDDRFSSRFVSKTTLYDINGDCSQVVVLNTETSSGNYYSSGNNTTYFETSNSFGYSSTIELWFANSFDQYFTPLYYLLLQHPQETEFRYSPLIQLTNLFSALTRHADILYYFDNEGSFQEDDEILYRIKYELEMSDK